MNLDNRERKGVTTTAEEEKQDVEHGKPKPQQKLDDEMMALVQQTAEGYAQRMRQGEKIGINTVLQEVLSAIMEKERDLFLQDATPPDAGNGFYTRMLQLAMGRLNLKVPRVRQGANFRPVLLPPKWKRVDKEYENLLLALLTNGYSQSQIERALHTLNLPYSQERVEELTSMIHERFEVFRKSPLPDTMFAVFIDAYHAKMRIDSRIRDISIFTVLGIDFDGYKSVLGFYVVEGDESRVSWSDVFQDLIQRGLKRVLLFVTDDFSGVKEMIKKLYPLSDHQLCCYIHMQRNLMRQLPKKVYSSLKAHLYSAKESLTKEDGLKHFDDACAIIEKVDRQYAERLRGRANNYLAFLDYPSEVRRNIYTTNGVESINSGLEYIRHELGGYFPSKESFDINYFVQIVNLNDGWMKTPNPTINSRRYELRQLLTMRFDLKDEEVRA